MVQQRNSNSQDDFAHSGSFNPPRGPRLYLEQQSLRQGDKRLLSPEPKRRIRKSIHRDENTHVVTSSNQIPLPTAVVLKKSSVSALPSSSTPISATEVRSPNPICPSGSNSLTPTLPVACSSNKGTNTSGTFNSSTQTHLPGARLPPSPALSPPFVPFAEKSSLGTPKSSVPKAPKSTPCETDAHSTKEPTSDTPSPTRRRQYSDSRPDPNHTKIKSSSGSKSDKAESASGSVSKQSRSKEGSRKVSKANRLDLVEKESTSQKSTGSSSSSVLVHQPTSTSSRLGPKEIPRHPTSSFWSTTSPEPSSELSSQSQLKDKGSLRQSISAVAADDTKKSNSMASDVSEQPKPDIPFWLGPLTQLILTALQKQEHERALQHVTHEINKFQGRPPELQVHLDIPRQRVSQVRKRLDETERQVQEYNAVLGEAFPAYFLSLFSSLPQSGERVPTSRRRDPGSSPSEAVKIGEYASRQDLDKLTESFEKHRTKFIERHEHQIQLLDRTREKQQKFEKRDDELTNFIQSMRDEIDQLKANQASSSNQVVSSDVIQTATQSLRQEVADLRRENSSLKTQFQTLSNKVADSTKHRASQDKSVQECTLLCKTTSQRIDDLAKKTAELQSREQTSTSRLGPFKKVDSGKRPSSPGSSSSWSDSTLSQVSREVKEMQVKMMRIVSEAAERQKQFDSIEKIQKQLQSPHGLASSLPNPEVMSQLCSFNTKLNALSEHQTIPELIKDLQTWRVDSKVSIKKIETKQNNHKSLLKTMDENFDKLRAEVAVLSQSSVAPTLTLVTDMLATAKSSDIEEVNKQIGLLYKKFKKYEQMVKDLDESQKFSTNAFGQQLDDLRQVEVPRLVDEVARPILDEKFASFEVKIEAKTTEQLSLLEAKSQNNNAAAANVEQSSVSTAASLAQYKETPKAIGHPHNMTTRLSNRIDSLHTQYESLIQMFHSLNVQYQNLQTSDIYNAIVEQLEYWHPNSTRSMLDDLVRRLEIQEALLGSMARSETEGPNLKRRRIEEGPSPSSMA